MESSPSHADNERLLQAWGRNWTSHDLPAILSLFPDDVIYEDETMGVVNRSKGELKAFAEDFFKIFPDVTFELKAHFAAANLGGAEWVMRGTQRGDMPGIPATGKHVEVRGASVLEFVNGKIKRCSDYWDMATLLRQLGVLPAA